MSLLCGDALTFFRKALPMVPGNYLEIGVYDGELIGTLAKEFPDKKFFGVDPFIEDGHTSQHNGVEIGKPMVQQRENAHRNLDSLPNVTLIESTSVEFSNSGERIPSISAILIDGSHHYEDVDNDFKLSSRLLKNGGVLYVDDLGTDGVAKACFEFVDRESHRIIMRDNGRFWIAPA